jgi:hypothetical protein
MNTVFRVDEGQDEWVRVPMADGKLVATSEAPDDTLVPNRRN